MAISRAALPLLLLLPPAQVCLCICEMHAHSMSQNTTQQLKNNAAFGLLTSACTQTCHNPLLQAHHTAVSAVYIRCHHCSAQSSYKSPWLMSADDYDRGYGDNYNDHYGRGYFGDEDGNFQSSAASAAAASSSGRRLLGDGYYYGYHNYHERGAAAAAAAASGGDSSAAASAASSGASFVV